MKKHVIIVFFVALFCSFTGCGTEGKVDSLFRENQQNGSPMEEMEETLEESAWKLNYESIELYTEDFVSMNLIAESEEGIKESISWKSENENIATVDDSGTVTAKEIGSTTVTATYHGVSQDCSVVVSDFDKSYAESIDAYAEFLRGGTATIASESGLKQIKLDKWVVCDLGDSSIKELIVVDGTTLYVFTYRMGEVCNTGEKAWVEVPNEDNKEVDYFYFDGADNRAVYYSDKQLNYFGKQSIMSIWIENGQFCFLRFYDLHAAEVKYDSDIGYEELCENTEEMIQKCLMPYKDRSFQEDEQREDLEEEELDEEEREDSEEEDVLRQDH